MSFLILWYLILSGFCALLSSDLVTLIVPIPFAATEVTLLSLSDAHTPDQGQLYKLLGSRLSDLDEDKIKGCEFPFFF